MSKLNGLLDQVRAAVEDADGTSGGKALATIEAMHKETLQAMERMNVESLARFERLVGAYASAMERQMQMKLLVTSPQLARVDASLHRARGGPGAGAANPHNKSSSDAATASSGAVDEDGIREVPLDVENPLAYAFDPTLGGPSGGFAPGGQGKR